MINVEFQTVVPCELYKREVNGVAVVCLGINLETNIYLSNTIVEDCWEESGRRSVIIPVSIACIANCTDMGNRREKKKCSDAMCGSKSFKEERP